MADRFDEMSKHMANKHSRRGAFRLLGAGFLGAAIAGALPTIASARGPFERTSRLWFVNVNGQNFNTLDEIRIRWNGNIETD